MQVHATDVAGVLLLEPVVHGDDRGFFFEVWREDRYRNAGIDARFVQENHSHSRQWTVRGLHYQVERPQGKLIRAVSGTIFDVAVDLRRSSPSYGRWTGAELSSENHRQLWIPPGCAHGFVVTSSHADIVYLCTDFYAPDLERTIQWDDPELAIHWPIGGASPILSAKDRTATPFRQAELFA
jgi:dTDP-4-dehydrorhamnose 3,5-epimerase